MAYTVKGYSNFWYLLLKGLVTDLSDYGTNGLDGTIIKGALMTDSYVFNVAAQDTHQVWSDVSAYEIPTADPVYDPDSDYPIGGLQFPTKAGGASVAIVDNVTTVDFEDAEANPVTFGGYALVIYDATPALPADQVLICHCEFGKFASSNSGRYRIVLNAGGLFSMTMTR